MRPPRFQIVPAGTCLASSRRSPRCPGVLVDGRRRIRTAIGRSFTMKRLPSALRCARPQHLRCFPGKSTRVHRHILCIHGAHWALINHRPGVTHAFRTQRLHVWAIPDRGLNHFSFSLGRYLLVLCRRAVPLSRSSERESKINTPCMHAVFLLSHGKQKSYTTKGGSSSPAAHSAIATSIACPLLIAPRRSSSPLLFGGAASGAWTRCSTSGSRTDTCWETARTAARATRTTGS